MGLENAAKEKNKPLEKAHDILAKKENVQDSLENVK